MIRAAFTFILAFASGGAALADAGQCLALRKPLAAGEFITREVAMEVPCREEQPHLPIRYDRAARAPAAVEAMAEGAYLGRLSLKSGAVAAPGDKLELVVRNGPVTITREVSPVQAVRAGNSAFVKTGDGEVLTARFIPAEGTR